MKYPTKEELIDRSHNVWQRLIFLLKEDSWQGLARNLTIMATTIVLGIFLFFVVYLPSTTNHGQIITMPNVIGMELAEARIFLEKRDLRIEIQDSTFASATALVTTQVPEPNAKVKIFRKVYLKVEHDVAEQVELPDILGTPLDNAQTRLRKKGFTQIDISYVPNPARDQVLRAKVGGEEFAHEAYEEGIFVYQNQQIELFVGDGIGKTLLKAPDLIDRPLDEAEVYILGLNLRLGNLRWVESDKPYGTVLNQNPKPHAAMRVNQSIDLWIADDPDYLGN